VLLASAALLRALGTKNDARYNLKIVDVGGPKPAPSQAPAPVAAVPVDDSAPADTEVIDTPSDTPVSEETTSGADAWAHLRSDDTSDDSSDAGTDGVDESSTGEETEESSVVEKTRKELEDLADINI
jgi:hypothetical protein